TGLVLERQSPHDDALHNRVSISRTIPLAARSAACSLRRVDEGALARSLASSRSSAAGSLSATRRASIADAAVMPISWITTRTGRPASDGALMPALPS